MTLKHEPCKRAAELHAESVRQREASGKSFSSAKRRAICRVQLGSTISIAEVLKTHRDWKIFGLHGCNNGLQIVATFSRHANLLFLDLRRDFKF